MAKISNLAIALISDALTESALKIDNELVISNMSDRIFDILKLNKIDFLFVESAWQGYKNRWKYKIASYPDVPSVITMRFGSWLKKPKIKEFPLFFGTKKTGCILIVLSTAPNYLIMCLPWMKTASPNIRR